LNVTAERIPESQVVLTIEIDPERVEKSMEQTYRRVAPRLRIPGFRPGKAPRRIVEAHVGRQALLEEALDKLVPEVVEEAIKEQGIEMIERPDLEITSLEPVVVKATVPVRPTVELGDYQAVRVEETPVQFDDEEVDRSIEALRRRQATIEPVERPIQDGDRIRASVAGTVDGDEVMRQDDADLSVREDALTGLPGLYEKLIGLSGGETAEADATLPDDYARAELAGKPIHYTIHVADVKEEKLPDLDDEFARGVGEGFDTVVELRERLTTDIRERAEQEAKRELQEKAIDALLQGASVEYPPQMVDREIDHMLRDMFQGVDDPKMMDRFLQRVGRTQEQIRDEVRPSAIERVKRTLVLSKLADAEGITVAPEEVSERLATLVGDGPNAAQIRQMFDNEQGHDMIQRQIHSERTLDRLTRIVTGKAATETETTAESSQEGAVETQPATETSEDQGEAPAVETE